MNFDDWFYEQEGYSVRAERFWSDYDAKDQIAMLKWLRSAYKIGYEDGQSLYGGTE